MIHNIRQLYILLSLCLVMVMVAIGVSIIIEDDEEERVSQFIISKTPGNLREQVIQDIIHYFNPRLTWEKQVKICQTILEKCEKFNLEPFFVAGIIAAESSFRPGVVSRCKARGLMQITDCVSKMMDVNDPYDIEQNIYAGTKYLTMLRERFKDEELILAAYNAGPTRVARLRRIPRIRETICYVKRITKLKEKLENMYLTKVKQSYQAVSLSFIAWGGQARQAITGELTAVRSGLSDNPLECNGPRRLFFV